MHQHQQDTVNLLGEFPSLQMHVAETTQTHRQTADSKGHFKPPPGDDMAFLLTKCDNLVWVKKSGVSDMLKHKIQYYVQCNYNLTV